jgi:hypothetical protein
LNIVCGIDEAGYGPRLGPLVVGCSAFSAEDDVPTGRELARTLSPRVRWVRKRLPSRRPGPHRDTVLIGDSKILYSRDRRGLARLEGAVLAFVGAAYGEIPARLDDLQRLLCCSREDEGFPPLPWYGRPGLELPLAADSHRVAEQSIALRDHLSARGLSVHLGCRLVPETEYNHRVACDDNKASLLFRASLEAALVTGLERNAGVERRATVFLDRQGGRKYYAALLEASFPLCPVTAVEEGAARSCYRVETGGDRLTFDFLLGGEDRQPAIALASMVAKYVREVVMESFNRHWKRRVPDLAPTAGYWTDAGRFLAELDPHLLPSDPDRRLFVRQV